LVVRASKVAKLLNFSFLIYSHQQIKNGLICY
jgi:hypothetical protein